jgi:hypothetical protein
MAVLYDPDKKYPETDKNPDKNLKNNSDLKNSDNNDVNGSDYILSEFIPGSLNGSGDSRDDLREALR